MSKSSIWLFVCVFALPQIVLPGALQAQDSGPVYLDEPEPAPKPTVAQRATKVPQKYEDGTLRAERDVLRLSNDQIVNHGNYVEYYRNGEKFTEGTFNHGIYDGQWTFWHDNGQLCKRITFKDGLAHGSWEVFDEEGNLKQKKSYDMGQRDGLWTTYYPDGKQPKIEMPLASGKINGERILYFPNGKIRQKSLFKDGLLEGTTTEWDESGRKRAEVEFKNNKRHGLSKVWNNDGKEQVRKYSNGEMVKNDG